ncbi:MAG: Fic family protein [Ornithinimicrobium sp.]|uniref:Fic family protein n=1 Tax=Ornithinimicrobium sp. TaxID=1977084 RepID=UPI003D9B37C6
MTGALPPPRDADPLAALAALPDVAEAVQRARDACTELRWHPALRRRTAEAAAESRVRGAAATALLEGAEPAGSQGSVPVVRDLVRGARQWPTDPDPVWRMLRAAVQVTAATEQVHAATLSAPLQVLTRLHLAAGAPLLGVTQVGRPRCGEETCREWVELGRAPDPEEVEGRLAAVMDLVRGVPAGRSPALLVASVVHAEIVTLRPFVAGNGLVARAMERVVLRAGGLDPTGVLVPESGHAAKVGADYRGALTAYESGSPDGVRLWLLHCAEAVVAGASEGHRVADAVLAGRTG